MTVNDPEIAQCFFTAITPHNCFSFFEEPLPRVENKYLHQCI